MESCFGESDKNSRVTGAKSALPIAVEHQLQAALHQFICAIGRERRSLIAI